MLLTSVGVVMRHLPGHLSTVSTVIVQPMTPIAIPMEQYIKEQANLHIDMFTKLMPEFKKATWTVQLIDVPTDASSMPVYLN